MYEEEYQNTIFSKVLAFVFLVQIEERGATAPVAGILLVVEICNFIESPVHQRCCLEGQCAMRWETAASCWHGFWQPALAIAPGSSEEKK